MTQPLKRLAEHIAEDPFFLAPVLRSCAESEGLDEAALAARLACSAETLTLLKLCRNPSPQPPQFWQDIQQIAEHFGVDAERLAEVVRLGQNICRLQETRDAVPREAGFLMAARDGETPPEKPS
jgi:hypothetical protein